MIALPVPNCCPDVLRGGIVVWAETVEGRGCPAMERRIVPVERLVMAWEGSRSKVGDCCDCFGCERGG